MSAAEWLSRAPKSLAAEAAQMLEKAGERLRAEREAALAKARALEAQLRELGLGDSPEPKAKAKVWSIRLSPDVQEEPAADWSTLRLAKHYLKEHPDSLAADVASFVASIRGNDENVLSTLYKYSRDGRPLKQTGKRGSYRYSLREEAET
jgi:uncharacterized damage-inducible protein DinB